jgi:hypothetical protein
VVPAQRRRRQWEGSPAQCHAELTRIGSAQQAGSALLRSTHEPTHRNHRPRTRRQTRGYNSGGTDRLHCRLPRGTHPSR